jgi:RimJ/RimL family protein N-acetyltransferase
MSEPRPVRTTTTPSTPDGTQPPRLLTPRLSLRPFADDLSDVDELHAIQSDAHHMRYYPHPFTRDETRAWIERAIAHCRRFGFGLWAIDDRRTGAFLGNCGPLHQTVDRRDEVELGWSVTPARAGQGIATEAASAWRDHCLRALALPHVIALVRPQNAPSRRVAEKIGMTVWKSTTFGSMGWPHLVYRLPPIRAPR